MNDIIETKIEEFDKYELLKTGEVTLLNSEFSTEASLLKHSMQVLNLLENTIFIQNIPIYICNFYSFGEILNIKRHLEFLFYKNKKVELSIDDNIFIHSKNNFYQINYTNIFLNKPTKKVYSLDDLANNIVNKNDTPKLLIIGNFDNFFYAKNKGKHILEDLRYFAKEHNLSVLVLSCSNLLEINPFEFDNYLLIKSSTRENKAILQILKPQIKENSYIEIKEE